MSLSHNMKAQVIRSKENVEVIVQNYSAPFKYDIEPSYYSKGTKYLFLNYNMKTDTNK